jgi:hypothetical protein
MLNNVFSINPKFYRYDPSPLLERRHVQVRARLRARLAMRGQDGTVAITRKAPEHVKTFAKLSSALLLCGRPS